MPADRLRVADEIAAALAGGSPVVALETAVLTHGLPHPQNIEAMASMCAAVREAGAVPAPIGVLRGQAVVGLAPPEWERLLERPAKCSVRDLAAVMALGGNAGTTVAATAHLAHQAGIRTFATGGLGGVHRDWARHLDISADLPALARLPVIVVSSGVKSILDLGATVEMLETLSVAVVGYGVESFPGFYVRETPWKVPHVARSPDDVARIRTVMDDIGVRSALLAVQPGPIGLSREDAEAAVADAVAAMEESGVRGQAVTPFLLDHLNRAHGETLRNINVALLIHNASLAGRIARAGAGHGGV